MIKIAMKENKKIVDKSISAGSPIGIFDSGLGGLTVALDIVELLPDEKFIYVGDNAHFPYGKKSLEQVREYCLAICHWLVDQGVKLIIIACNTATVAALQAIQQEISVPVIGVLGPGARTATNKTSNNKIGVLATEATISSGAYKKEILKHIPDANVVSVAAPALVELAENGIKDFLRNHASKEEKLKILKERTSFVCPKNISLVEEYAQSMKDAQVDTVVLGCTHFPLLRPLLSVVYGPYVSLVSCGRETVKDVVRILRNSNMLAVSKQGDTEINNKDSLNKNKFYTTGTDVRKFEEFGSIVFGEELINVNCVNI